MYNLPFETNSNFTTITQLIPKELGIRKKLEIYTANDDLKQTYLFIYLVQKSRFLQKDIDKIEEIFTIIQNYTNTTFDKKFITIEAPLCSKAKAKLENNFWSCKNIL